MTTLKELMETKKDKRTPNGIVIDPDTDNEKCWCFSCINWENLSTKLAGFIYDGDRLTDCYCCGCDVG